MIVQASFLESRDFLLAKRADYEGARNGFVWPRMPDFNWALDYFDPMAVGNEHQALWIVEESGEERRLSFAALATRSNQVANWLRAQGVRRGDRLLLMLGNEVALWEVMLAAMKLGVVLIPTAGLLARDDLRDRIARGAVRHIVTGSANAPKVDTLGGDFTRIAVGEPTPGWLDFAQSSSFPATFTPDARTRADGPAAPLFHVGNHGQAQTRAAYARELPGRASLDDVLDRPSSRRHPSQHLVAGVGKARVELFLRAVERGGLRLHLQLRALQCEGDAGRARTLPRHDALCATDRLAHVDPGGSRGVSRASRPPRADRRGRTAESGDHRPRAGSLGDHGSRRLRPDGNDRDGRKFPGATSEAGFDGAPASRLRRGAAGRRRQPCGRRRGLDPHRSASGRVDGGLFRRFRNCRSRRQGTSSTAPATWRDAMPRATSGTSVAPTTCSSRRTTGFRRSNWSRSPSNIRRSERRRWCPALIRCVSQCRSAS